MQYLRRHVPKRGRTQNLAFILRGHRKDDAEGEVSVGGQGRRYAWERVRGRRGSDKRGRGGEWVATGLEVT